MLIGPYVCGKMSTYIIKMFRNDKTERKPSKRLRMKKK